MYFILIAAHTYVVQPGDTLSQRFGSSWPAVCQANNLASCDLIYPGQRLIVVTSGGQVQTSYAVRADGDGDSDGDVSDGSAGASVSTSPAQTYSGAPGTFQSCVIARESGGDATAVNPHSGAGGLYQFLPSTWHALGFSGLPQDASVATQNQAFQQAYAQSGTSPWRPYDGCLQP